MFFTIKSTAPEADLAIYRAKKQATYSLITYELGVTDLLLNRYFQENHNIGLKAVCLKIIRNMRFSLNFQGEIIATIPDETLNNFARIITYGNGRFLGSRILRKILTI